MPLEINKQYITNEHKRITENLKWWEADQFASYKKRCDLGVKLGTTVNKNPENVRIQWNRFETGPLDLKLCPAPLKHSATLPPTAASFYVTLFMCSCKETTDFFVVSVTHHKLSLL